MKKQFFYKYLFLFITMGIIFSSCIKYHPYEVRLEDDEENLNILNIEQIQKIPEQDTFTFVFAGDAQRFYDEAFPLVDHINNDPEIQFVFFAGDFTDFGLAAEFQGMNEIVDDLNVPYVVALGNHDLVYNGHKVYERMFGPFDFSFDLHDFRFVFANTNSREFGFDGTVPNISWLNEQLADTSEYFGAVVVVHVPPSNVDFDGSLEEDFASALSDPGKTIMELNGHNHGHATSYPYDGSIEYITSYSLNNRKYLKMKIWKGTEEDESHSFEIVEF